MPTSDYHGVSDIMGEILKISPRTVLELGVGFGKWGVLCRELLDAAYGRCARDDWQAVLLGYEIHGSYKNPAWSVYNQVAVRDFMEISHSQWDLVLMIDSLEHIDPERGRLFLRDLVANNRHVIVSVPNGKMEQGEVFGNPHEAHLWTFDGLAEFEPYRYKVLHRGVCTVVSIEGGR